SQLADSNKKTGEELRRETQAASAADALEVAAESIEPTTVPAAKSVFASSLTRVPFHLESGIVEVSTQQSIATVTPSTKNTSNDQKANAEKEPTGMMEKRGGVR
ncbi:hypothetical protein PENTCL1PPCAC_20226, partial [Pristionchus entomophagus]